MLPPALNFTFSFFGTGRLRQWRLCFERTRWTHFCPNPYIMVLGWMSGEMLTCAELWWKKRSLRFRITGVPFLARKNRLCSIFYHKNSIKPGWGWMLLAAKSDNMMNGVIGLKGRRKKALFLERNIEQWSGQNYWILSCLIRDAEVTIIPFQFVLWSCDN